MGTVREDRSDHVRGALERHREEVLLALDQAVGPSLLSGEEEGSEGSPGHVLSRRLASLSDVGSFHREVGELERVAGGQARPGPSTRPQLSEDLIDRSRVSSPSSGRDLDVGDPKGPALVAAGLQLEVEPAGLPAPIAGTEDRGPLWGVSVRVEHEVEELVRGQTRPHVRQGAVSVDVGVANVAGLGASPAPVLVAAPLVDRPGQHWRELVKPDLLRLTVEPSHDLEEREAAPNRGHRLLDELVESAV